jgi:hypothetical protein
VSDAATTELAQLVTLKRRIAAALALHTSTHRHFCTECGFPAPCATERALRGEGL